MNLDDGFGPLGSVRPLSQLPERVGGQARRWVLGVCQNEEIAELAGWING